MATYKGIQGYMVESLASDPGTLSEVVGKLWYNSGSNVWKLGKEGSGAWSSGGDTNSPHYRSAAGGTQTAALAFGSGGTAPYPVNRQNVESYDGATWTEVADLNTGRLVAGSAQQAPAPTSLAMGGDTPPPTFTNVETELYDGTCWTEVNDLNTGRKDACGFGISTAGVMAGGAVGPSTSMLASVEEYNGSCWTEVTAMPTATSELDAAGIETSGLVFGGSPYPIASTYEYNGTGWTDGGDLNTARGAGMGCGATQTAALCFGGETPPTPTNQSVKTELYNGTCWTEVADLATGRNSGCGAGTSTGGLCISGAAPDDAATEEWDSPNYEAATVTTS